MVQGLGMRVLEFYDGQYCRVHRLRGSRSRGDGVDGLNMRTKGRYVDWECGDYVLIGVWVYGAELRNQGFPRRSRPDSES
jgi:hypothetical protein